MSSNSNRSLKSAKNNSSSKSSSGSKKSFYSIYSSSNNKIEGNLRFNNVNKMSSVNKVNLYPAKNKLSFLDLFAFILAILLIVYIVIAVTNYFKPIKFLPKSYFFPTRDNSD